MKTLTKTIYITIFSITLLSFNSHSQNVSQNDSLEIKLKKAALDIISNASTCALITLDVKGIPIVRTMDPFQPESDFTIWFGTNSKSRKVTQLKNNPIVTLYYPNKENSGYVVLYGEAQLINDPKEKETHWKPEWEAFYPDKSDDNYLLIKVTPKWMEVLNIPQGILGDPITWKTPIVHFN